MAKANAKKRTETTAEPIVRSRTNDTLAPRGRPRRITDGKGGLRPATPEEIAHVEELERLNPPRDGNDQEDGIKSPTEVTEDVHGEKAE